MKKGQTSVRAGIQDILYPLTIMRLTQGDGVGTHKGTYAIDDAGKDTGRDYAYFPFDAKSVALDTAKNGNAVVWESLKPVRFADGSIDYACIMVVHDDDPTGFDIGSIYRQGQQMAQEGTAGNARGAHLHLEFAKGKFKRGNKGMYSKNQHGVYHLTNNLPVEKVCFMDGTTILRGIADWKYLKDVNVDTPVKPPVNANKPDQILRKGEKFIFNEVYKVDGMKLINKRWAVFNKELGAYITVGLIDMTDIHGKKTVNQVAKVGLFFKVPGIFTVEKTVKNDVFPVGWGFGVDAETLYEV